MYRCVFILPDDASREDAKALGIAICRLRLEVGLRKRVARKRRLQASKYVSLINQRLIRGCLAKRTTLTFDMRMSEWPEDLYPLGMDASTRHAKLRRANKPPPPICRCEMIHILHQYLPVSVVEDVLVDDRSWNEA